MGLLFIQTTAKIEMQMYILNQGRLEKGKPYLENKLVNQAILLDPRMKDYSFGNDRNRCELTKA